MTLKQVVRMISAKRILKIKYTGTKTKWPEYKVEGTKQKRTQNG